MTPQLSIVDRRPSESAWKIIEQTAQHIVDSGLLNQWREVPNQSLLTIILLKGWELGLPLMSSLEHIRVIKGHLSLSAECQQALVLSRVVGSQFEWLNDGKNGVAEVVGSRPGHTPVSVRFSHEDAVKTGLADRNPIYKTYSANLLRSAAVRAVCKRLFPDVLMGLDSASEVESEDEEQDPITHGSNITPVGNGHVGSNITHDDMGAGSKETHHSVGRDPEPSSVPETKPNGLPEDMRLPFDKGEFLNVCLSDLDETQMGRLARGFSKRAAKAREEGNERSVATNSSWAERVLSWASYRGYSVSLESLT